MKKVNEVQKKKLDLKKRTIIKLSHETIARLETGITGLPILNTEEANCTGNTIRTNSNFQ